MAIANATSGGACKAAWAKIFKKFLQEKSSEKIFRKNLQKKIFRKNLEFPSPSPTLRLQMGENLGWVVTSCQEQNCKKGLFAERRTNEVTG